MIYEFDNCHVDVRAAVTSRREAANYYDYVVGKTGKVPKKIIATADDEGYVQVEYWMPPQKFERIRRITGYLVGSTDRWNDSKRAEEKDRVKHGI